MTYRHPARVAKKKTMAQLEAENAKLHTQLMRSTLYLATVHAEHMAQNNVLAEITEHELADAVRALFPRIMKVLP